MGPHWTSAGHTESSRRSCGPRRSAAKLLTKDEVRQMAVNFAIAVAVGRRRFRTMRARPSIELGEGSPGGSPHVSPQPNPRALAMNDY